MILCQWLSNGDVCQSVPHTFTVLEKCQVKCVCSGKVKMDLAFGTETPELDVLIVGAGLSGLTSAVKIISKEPALNIKIIDENSTPGGQLLGEDGTCFIDAEQQKMIAFVSILNVQPRLRTSHVAKLKRCWDLDRGLTSSLARFELWRYINMLDLRMKKFRSPNFRIRKRLPTMERHICYSLFFNKSRRFMLNIVELVCGVDASEVNYDEFMCVCSSSGGVRSIIDLYFTFPNSISEISSKTLVNGLKEKLHLVEIISNRKVIKVEHYKNYVQVTDSDGDKYTAQTVILAIPWNKVEQLNFEPAVPKAFRQPPRVTMKPKRLITQFHMRYPKSYWNMLGYSGHFLCSMPLLVGHEIRPNAFTGYMLHTLDEVGSVRSLVLDQLAQHFGDEMQEPLDYEENTNELSVALNMPQTKPWHRIIWSSSAAVGTLYRNLLGGAVQSGLRAAIHALFVVRPQVVAWKDLLDLHDNDQYAAVNTSRIRGLFSRLNLYNVSFYSLYVLALVMLLNLGYQRSPSVS